MDQTDRIVLVDHYTKAGFLRRLAAYLIDYLLISGSYFFIFFMFIKDYSIFTPYAFGIYLLFYFYNSFCNYIWQKTIGKAIFKIKVVGKADKLTFKEAFLRQINILLFLVRPLDILIFVDDLWMLWDKQKQTIHDKLAGTNVVLIGPNNMILLARN